jgi:L-aspartate oxidase
MKTDVLIIGSGLAGLYTALNIDQKLSVLFVTKEKIDSSSSWLAQGGIAAAISGDDTPEYHLEDTLSAGAGLCDEQAVRILASEGPSDIRRLVDLRVPFDLDEEGDLAITREGGHTRRRVVHAGGDATGRETVRALMKHAVERNNITFMGDCFITRLCLSGGSVCGAAAWAAGKEVLINASHTVLATGGLGQIYDRTTNPGVSTGDGFALAIQAGAELRDMEFVQFHPTGLYHPDFGGSAFLITEAMRGEGAVLRGASGERFTDELAPRDIVSRAIIRELKRSGEKCVTLDATSIVGPEKRFPTIAGECARRGIDITRDPIPVCPVQHYQVGGIRVDLSSKTSIPNLYAVGEVSCTGVHGANRLASNSMLECLVFGRKAAEAINGSSPTEGEGCGETAFGLAPKRKEDIQRICSTYAGIERTAAGLKFGAAAVNGILTEKQPANERGEMETYNMALTAEAVLTAASKRLKSVGVHYIERDGAEYD